MCGGSPPCLSCTNQAFLSNFFIVHADREDKKLVVLAVLAWFVRRSAHVISLVLIFNVGMKDGLLHAVYSEFQVLLTYLCDMVKIPMHFHEYSRMLLTLLW